MPASIARREIASDMAKAPRVSQSSLYVRAKPKAPRCKLYKSRISETKIPASENTMGTDSSRRNFLVAGLSLPVAGMATAQAPQASPAWGSRPASPAAAVRYRTLGRTWLKVSTVGYGCMITSDSSVISRAVDLGITYFDTDRKSTRLNSSH